MLKLIPSLREKKRYFVYEVISKSKIQDKPIVDTLNDALMKFMGSIEMARAGIMMVEIKDNKGIIKVEHNYIDEVKAGLMMIKTIDNKEVIVRSLSVSGAIEKVRRMI